MLGPIILAAVGLGLVIAPVINTGTFGVAPQDAGVAYKAEFCYVARMAAGLIIPPNAAGECSTNTAVSRYTRHSPVRVRSARPGMFQIASPRSCWHY